MIVVVLIAIAVMRFNLTALGEPGRLETSVANWGTQVPFWIVQKGIGSRECRTYSKVETGDHSRYLAGKN